MTLSRSVLSDRRRRVLREVSGAAPAKIGARTRQRLNSSDESDETTTIPGEMRRDAGYSQSVRRSCQHRLVQLIPVRRTSLIAVVSTGWVIWASLLFGHFWVFGSDSSKLSQLEFAQLFNVRSLHSITHWLVIQLWMLTALAAFLIYQLRKHKMDDYRAQYRVWLGLVAAALAASLDASSQALRLLANSLDAWCRAEVGYSGWAMVLATFAVLVGVLGLRLCSELKSAPASLLFWLGGLLAWAVSALLGTDLLVTNWSKLSTDLVVGGAWLGGVLAVWMSAGIYLRHIYIQAQRRVMIRGGLLPTPIQFRLPKFTKRAAENTRESDSNADHNQKLDGSEIPKRWLRLPHWSSIAFRKRNGSVEEQAAESPRQQRRREALLLREEARHQAEVIKLARLDERPTAQDRAAGTDQEASDEVRSPKARWALGFGRRTKTSVSNEQLSNATNPLTSTKSQKTGKHNWMPQWGRSKQSPAESDHRAKHSDSHPLRTGISSESNAKHTPGKRASWWRKKSKPIEGNESAKVRKDADRGSSEKLSWWRRKPKDISLDMSVKPKSKIAEPKSDNANRTGSNWLKARTSQKPNNADQKSKDPAKPKRNWFGFLDNLKLKPPVDADSTPIPLPKPVNANPGSSSSTRPPLAAFNNSSRTPQANSVNQTRQMPSTMPIDGSDPEDRQDLYDRQLSKAERKRMRRTNDQNRAA